MKVMKKCMALVLMMVLAVGLCSSIDVEAAATPGKPKITVSTLKDGTGVSVSIAKTKNADGYEIVCKGTGDSYNDDDEVSYDYTLKLKVAKDGTEKRTQTIEPIQPGTYEIKARAYKGEGKSIKYGKYSKVAKVTIKSDPETTQSSFDFSGVKKGDVIKFGSYEQDNKTSNGKEEIEWVVLSKSDSEMMLLSVYALDCLPYNDEHKFVTWETCTLRKWLNGTFYDGAFSKSEKEVIKNYKVKNYDNTEYNIDGGNDTSDYVFLLSINDVVDKKYGFATDIETEDTNRICAPTAYAVSKGTNTDTCLWWLRTLGCDGVYAANVGREGMVWSGGQFVTKDNYGIRPVIVIDLKK